MADISTIFLHHMQSLNHTTTHLINIYEFVSCIVDIVLRMIFIYFSMIYYLEFYKNNAASEVQDIEDENNMV
jgi:hypothetical protein